MEEPRDVGGRTISVIVVVVAVFAMLIVMVDLTGNISRPLTSPSTTIAAGPSSAQAPG